SNFRDALLALSTREFFVGFGLVRGAAHARRRYFCRIAVAGTLVLKKFRRDFHPGGTRFQVRYYFSAATPACEIVSSCEPLPPETPMAPMSLPPTTSGLPPREPTNPFPSVGR